MKLTLFHKVAISLAAAGVAFAAFGTSPEQSNTIPPPAPVKASLVNTP